MVGLGACWTYVTYLLPYFEKAHSNDLSRRQLVSRHVCKHSESPLNESFQPWSGTVGNAICAAHHGHHQLSGPICPGNCDFGSVSCHSRHSWNMSDSPLKYRQPSWTEECVSRWCCCKCCHVHLRLCRALFMVRMFPCGFPGLTTFISVACF